MVKQRRNFSPTLYKFSRGKPARIYSGDQIEDVIIFSVKYPKKVDTYDRKFNKVPSTIRHSANSQFSNSKSFEQSPLRGEYKGYYSRQKIDKRPRVTHTERRETSSYSKHYGVRNVNDENRAHLNVDKSGNRFNSKQRYSYEYDNYYKSTPLQKQTKESSIKIYSSRKPSIPFRKARRIDKFNSNKSSLSNF